MRPLSLSLQTSRLVLGRRCARSVGTKLDRLWVALTSKSLLLHNDLLVPLKLVRAFERPLPLPAFIALPGAVRPCLRLHPGVIFPMEPDLVLLSLHILACAKQQYVDVMVLGVPMLYRHPVQSQAFVLLKLTHHISRHLPQILRPLLVRWSEHYPVTQKGRLCIWCGIGLRCCLALTHQAVRLGTGDGAIAVKDGAWGLFLATRPHLVVTQSRLRSLWAAGVVVTDHHVLARFPVMGTVESVPVVPFACGELCLLVVRLDPLFILQVVLK